MTWLAGNRFADRRKISGSIVLVTNQTSAWYWCEGTISGDPFELAGHPCVWVRMLPTPPIREETLQLFRVDELSDPTA